MNKSLAYTKQNLFIKLTPKPNENYSKYFNWNFYQQFKIYKHFKTIRKFKFKKYQIYYYCYYH